MFLLFSSDSREDRKNLRYPHRIQVSDTASLAKAVEHDYVCAEYQDHCRRIDNFIVSDCIGLDCDNDHSEDPQYWVTPQNVADAFPKVSFMVHYNRNHFKAKGDKVARPKFHIMFPISPIRNADVYKELKIKAFNHFPFFDAGAMDAARVFYGTENPQVENFWGNRMLSDFLDDSREISLEVRKQFPQDIPEGTRNTTMYRQGCRLLIRWGDSEEARQRFLAESERCSPSLERNELERIWQNARKFFNERVLIRPEYVPSAIYNQEVNLKPGDLTDVGQAKVLASEYQGQLRYSQVTNYLVYTGSYWEESKIKAQGIAQELTSRQLEQAQGEVTIAKTKMIDNGAWDLLATKGSKNALERFNDEQAASYTRYTFAEEYEKYVLKRRKSDSIEAALKEARPLLEIDPKLLDKDEFLLNTPTLTYDLRKGLAGGREHDPEDFITKQTIVDPSSQGEDIWLKALDAFFCQDQELITYVQEVVGLAAIGKVYEEKLVIAYGDGRNGKSTFWNTVYRVLGTYGGTISSDILTGGRMGNPKNELAELRGKRMIIASELEEGVKLSASMLKKLCSTDDIMGEKKFRDPMAFTPTHTMVLCTNHLPEVKSTDTGTWRRLSVVPFKATIEAQDDRKDYATHLIKNAGGAVMSWIIEGAQRIIEKGFQLATPQAVITATGQYREDNDWLSRFLNECCDLNQDYKTSAREVYFAYKSYCERMGETPRSNTAFGSALSQKFHKSKPKNCVYHGFRLRYPPQNVER